jgi:hypothetical protein
MQDFLEAAKRAATAAAERAAWEVTRRQRAITRQHEIDLAQRERGTLVEQIAHIALDLETSGQLTYEPLRALCRRLQALDQEVAAGAADVKKINAETFTPGATGGAAGPAHKPIAAPAVREYPCPTCGRPVRDGAAFCAACGTRLR